MLSALPLRRWWPTSRSTPHAVSDRPSRRRKFALQVLLERLEDRTVPSAIPLHVTSLADSGAGTLRDAIQSANADTSQAYTIDFGVTGTIELESSLPALNGSVTINGPGANLLTVERDPSAADFGVLSVGAGATVDLSGVTIANGSAASGGGGIDNGGTLNASWVTVENNQSAGGQGGGGILNEPAGQLTLDDSVVRDNVATAAPGSDVFGGGLLNLGHATIDAGTFVGNKAEGGAGLDFFGGSAGGAIDNFGGATLEVTNSRFCANQAVGAADDANGSYFGMGGAVENNAGYGMYDSSAAAPSTATFTGCIFAGNVATTGDGGTANGGALDNQGFGTTMSLTDCTIIGNEALGGSNGFSGEAIGGGIMNLVGSTLSLTDCNVAANRAQGGSGATPNADLPGAGLGSGGGISNASATLTVSNSLIAGNLAAGGRTTVGPGGNALGGGIDNADLVPGLPATLALADSRVLGNTAVAASGGTNASPDGILLGVAAGGGLDDWADGSATVTGCVFAGNSVRGGAGGPGIGGGDAFGGGIAVGTNAYFGFADSATLSLTNSLVVLNTAVGGAGGTGASGGNAFGGGIAVWGTVPTTPDNPDPGGSTVTLKTTTVSLNAAIGGRRARKADAGEGRGGGLYVAPGGTVTSDTSTRIRWNFASTDDDNVSDDGGGFTTS